MKHQNIIPIFLIILAGVFLICTSNIFSKKSNEIQPQQEPSVVDIEPLQTSSVINIPVNEPTELSYKTKDEIYELRKHFFDLSIFKNSKYKPSEEVFGEIESSKPWVANDVCKDEETNMVKIDGPSEESRFINNPALLVAIEYPFYFSRYPSISWCTDRSTTLIPSEISYNGELKEIDVTYDKLPFTTQGNDSFYMFNGLNARDLGYKWAYIDLSKTTYDIDFSEEENISNQVIEFQNFLHLGGSCRHESGCNNGSPRQSFLEFKNNNDTYEYSNKEIYIKLWKNKPSSPLDVPDITEKIILKET